MSSIEQLRQAYQLLKEGKKSAAVEILRPICQTEPDNADAWWLLANALTEPRQIQKALQNLLLINPFHEQAQVKLDALLEHHPPITTTNLGTKKSTATKTKPKLRLFIVAVTVVVITMLAAIFLLLNNQENQTEAEQIQITLPTSIAENFTLIPSFTPSASPTATLTSTPRPTGTSLPATWTPTDSPTPDPNYVTITPWFGPTSTLATADPSLFGDTYWEGIGDGYTLDKFTRSGGRHLRFYEFPVKVHVTGGDSEWNSAVNSAILELSQVVLIERVEEESQATLTILIMPPDEYERWSGCPKDETLGCAIIFDLGDFGGGDTYHRIYGQVFLSTDSYNKTGTVLHEMMHALGVMVHSPEEGDIMYPIVTERTTLSQRDLNTLRRLYANPSYAD